MSERNLEKRREKDKWGLVQMMRKNWKQCENMEKPITGLKIRISRQNTANVKKYETKNEDK